MLAISLATVAFGRVALVLGSILAGLFFLLHFFAPTKEPLKEFEPRELEGRDPWRLTESLNSVVQHSARIPTPRLMVLPWSSPSTFSLGCGYGKPTIFLTQKLLEKLNADELEVVIAMQVAYLRLSGNTFQGVVESWENTVLGLVRRLEWRFFKKQLTSNTPTHLTVRFLKPIYRLFALPSRYYQIDALTAEWIQSPRRVAEVLWKLESYRETYAPVLVPYSGAFFLVPNHNPLGAGSVPSRIERLLGSYPI